MQAVNQQNGTFRLKCKLLGGLVRELRIRVALTCSLFVFSVDGKLQGTIQAPLIPGGQRLFFNSNDAQEVSPINITV